MENEQQIYYHDHGDGHVHAHELEPEHEHSHTHTHSHEGEHIHHHDHKQTKAVVNRLARAIGHLESVKHMVEDAARGGALGAEQHGEDHPQGSYRTLHRRC